MPSKKLRSKAVLIHSPVTRQESVDTDITMTEAPSDEYDFESPPTDAYLSSFDATEASNSKAMEDHVEETNSTPTLQKKEKYVVKIFDTDEEFYEVRNRRAKEYGMKFINKYDLMPVPIYDDKPPKEDVDVKKIRQKSAYKEDPLKNLISGFTKEAQTILEQSTSSSRCHEKTLDKQLSDPSILDIFRSGGIAAVGDHFNGSSLKENTPIPTNGIAKNNSRTRRNAKRAALGSSAGNCSLVEKCFVASDDGPDRSQLPVKDMAEQQESLPAPALVSMLRALHHHQFHQHCESLRQISEELDRQAENQENKKKTFQKAEELIDRILHEEKGDDDLSRDVSEQQIGGGTLNPGDLREVPIIQDILSKPQGQETLAQFLRGQTGIQKMEATARVKRLFENAEKDEHRTGNLPVVGAAPPDSPTNHKVPLEIEVDKTPSSSNASPRPPPGLHVPTHLREKSCDETLRTPCKKKPVVAQTVGGRRHANKRNSKATSKSSTPGAPFKTSAKPRLERHPTYCANLINYLFPSSNPTPQDMIQLEYTNTLAQGEEPAEVIYYATRAQAEESCRTRGLLPGWREGFTFNPTFAAVPNLKDIIRFVYENNGSKHTYQVTRPELKESLKFGKLPGWREGYVISEVYVMRPREEQVFHECTRGNINEEPSPDRLPSIGTWKGFDFKVDQNGRQGVTSAMQPQAQGTEHTTNFNTGKILNTVEKLMEGYPKSPTNECQMDLEDEVETVKAESDDEDDSRKTPEERKRDGMIKFFEMVSGQDQSGLTKILHGFAANEKGEETLCNLLKCIPSNGSSDEEDYEEEDGSDNQIPIPPINIIDLDQTSYPSPNSSPPTSPVLNPTSILPFTFTPPTSALSTLGPRQTPLPNITFPPATPARTTRTHHSTPLVAMCEDPDALLSHRTPKAPKPKPAHAKRFKYKSDDIDILLDLFHGHRTVDWDDLRARSKIAVDEEGALTVEERKMWGARHLMRHLMTLGAAEERDVE